MVTARLVDTCLYFDKNVIPYHLSHRAKGDRPDVRTSKNLLLLPVNSA